MKHLYTLVALLTVALLASCVGTADKTPKAKHVILIGIDAMGAYGVQRAPTPTLNQMIDNGAASIKARCILSSSSSQNWMSMVSGATINLHGVTDNDWEPGTGNIVPAVKNAKGLFPTIFDAIKTQKPEDKVYMFYEWTEQDRMYDTRVADKAVTGLDGEQTMKQAFDAFFADKPEFLFVSIDEVDHVGHASGHESQAYMECVHKYDALIGDLIKRLKEADMTDETIVIVTADHGGIGRSHGGTNEAEIEIPIILYGGTVTKGKLMEHTNVICDIAATVAGLLDVKLPRECTGQFISEAFEPKSELVYVPMPFIQPFNGRYKEQVMLTITGDVADGEIYYTTDGSAPTNQSTKYEAPVAIKQSCLVRAIVCRAGQYGKIAEADLRVLPEGETPRVAYKYYENMQGKSLPDFNKLGRPTREGLVYEFSLDELDVEEKDHFAVLFTTRFDIPADGEYTFGVISDDGSKVYVDGQLIIDNDGSHSAEMKRGKVTLTKGIHDIRVEYFDDYMGQNLELYYGSDRLPMQTLPFARCAK